MTEPSRPKTATVAPPPVATVNIRVQLKATGARVRGASGFATALSGPASAVRELGKTNPSGELKNIKFTPGRYRLFIVFKNHRGENMPQGDHASSTVVFDGELVDGKRDIEVSLIQVQSQVTVSVVEPVSNTPVAGARVVTGTFSGLTNANGKVTSDGLAMGALHTLTVTRAGFGAPSGSTESAVTGSVDLRGLTSVTDRSMTLEMKPVWGKVTSSRIRLEGQAFPTWYRDTFVPSFPPKHPTIRDLKGNTMLTFPAPGSSFSVAGFNQLFDDLPQWWGPELTVEEFVSIFLIVANETGGTFRPIAEKGTLSYMFYLNKPSNRLAGDQLQARGILTDEAQVKAWNTKGAANFPGTDTPPPNEADLKECDFWKYRGRGFVQLTLFPLYMDMLEPILLAAGLPGCEAMTSDELDAAVLNRSDVYYPMLKRYLSKVRSSWAATNGQQWRQFGLTVAGQGNTPYGDLYQFRAENLYARMSAAARDGTLELAP